MSKEMASQRRRRQSRRKRRSLRKSTQCNEFIIDNEYILNSIVNLPQQEITNNPFIDQFFNGSPFFACQTFF